MANVSTGPYTPMRNQLGDPSSVPAVLTNIDKLGSQLSKLNRLKELDKSLSKESETRQKQLADIEGIWSQAHQDLLDQRDGVSQALTQLGPFASIYRKALEEPLDLGKQVGSFKKDKARLGVMRHRISKTQAGLNGPTFLVTNLKGNVDWGFVIKYTDPYQDGDPVFGSRTGMIEPVSTRIYETLSQCLPLNGDSEAVSLGFSVPAVARLDLENRVFESASRDPKQLTPRTHSQLENHLRKLASLNSELKPATEHVMLSEKIPGQTLMDFSYTGYNHLTPQERGKFFERLGRLAVIDLLLGNLDRLAKPVVDESAASYFFDEEYPLESNVGNVMVVSKEEAPHFSLYAIDNEIAEELINNPDLKQKYSAFLIDTVKDLDSFAKVVAQSISSGLDAQVYEIDCRSVKIPNKDKVKTNDIKELYEPLKKDLASFGEESLKKGIVSTIGWLQGKVDVREEGFPFRWQHSDQARGLKEYLNRVHPDLLEAVEERIKILAEDN